MDVKRIIALKKAQEKQDIIENMIYSLKTSSKAINLRVEFDNDNLEFYPSDRDGYEIEPNKQGLIIYLEHEIKHCEYIKAEIVRELADQIKVDYPVIIEPVSEDVLEEMKQHMESGEQRFQAID